MVAKRGNLLTQLSNYLTSCSQLVTKRTKRAFALELRDRRRGTIIPATVRQLSVIIHYNVRNITTPIASVHQIIA